MEEKKQEVAFDKVEVTGRIGQQVRWQRGRRLPWRHLRQLMRRMGTAQKRRMAR